MVHKRQESPSFSDLFLIRTCTRASSGTAGDSTKNTATAATAQATERARRALGIPHALQSADPLIGKQNTAQSFAFSSSTLLPFPGSRSDVFFLFPQFSLGLLLLFELLCSALFSLFGAVCAAVRRLSSHQRGGALHAGPVPRTQMPLSAGGSEEDSDGGADEDKPAGDGDGQRERAEQGGASSTGAAKGGDWFSGVAGVVAGGGANVLMYPMDVVKARYQGAARSPPGLSLAATGTSCAGPATLDMHSCTLLTWCHALQSLPS